MFVTDVALAPYRATKLVVQTVTGLHEMTQRAQREEDPLSQLRDAIRDGLVDLDSIAKKADSLDGHLASVDVHAITLLREINTFIATARELIMGGADLTATGKELDGTAKVVASGAASLEVTATRLDGHAAELIDGGRELTVTAKSLDGHSAELIDGGQDLTNTAKHLDANAGQLNELAASLDTSLKLFRAALPQLLGALDTVEELEESIETVAETIEPLQATAEKVGRVTQRFSRKE